MIGESVGWVGAWVGQAIRVAAGTHGSFLPRMYV